MKDNSNIGPHTTSARRNFVKGAAGLLGIVGMSSALGQPATAGPAAPAPESQAGNPAAFPRGGGPPDCRATASFQSSIPEATKVLTQYFAALSDRNLDGMSQQLHYPFVTYEGRDGVLVETREQLISNPPLSMNVTGKGGSKLKPGAYDILDSIQAHVFSPVGAGLSLQYNRFDRAGSLILTCHGLYGITNNDGKWGIEWMSTIFKPANQIGRDDSYNDLIIDSALHENHRDHVMARKSGDLPELRRTVMDPYPHGSVSLGPSPVPGAPPGTPPEYRSDGIKSRLRYSKGDTQEEMARQNFGQGQFSANSGGSLGNWSLSIETPDTGVLFASAEKGHFRSGYFRYTEDGSIISEHRYIGALVNWKGNWYGNDISRIVGQVVYHDRTKDIPS
jgi:hypothetical protein